MTEQHRDPSQIDRTRSWFDEFAERVYDFTSRDAFFLVLVVATLLWLPSYFLIHDVSYWYIAFVLPAEVVTLFLVALLENNSRRSAQALHRKLDAFAEALAAIAAASPDAEVRKHAEELRAAVGLQDRESTNGD